MKRLVAIAIVLLSALAGAARGQTLSVGSSMRLNFIHPDHLNTPRQVYDDQQQLRWKWDQAEPFGVTVPDENPINLGAFELPLRFPGQYFDREDNLAYNYFRDYDPGIGRYAQSDPRGLDGGTNTFVYALGQPLRFVDPFGDIPILNAIGGVAGGISGLASGYIASGGSWSAALGGAAAGALFGLVNPFAGPYISGAYTGFFSSVAGQFIGNLKNTCIENPYEINYQFATINAITGGAAKGAFAYLNYTQRSAFTFQATQSMGQSSANFLTLSQAPVRGGISGVTQYGAKTLDDPMWRRNACACTPQ